MKPAKRSKPGGEVLGIRFPAAMLGQLDAYIARASDCDPGLTRSAAVRRLVAQALRASTVDPWDKPAPPLAPPLVPPWSRAVFPRASAWLGRRSPHVVGRLMLDLGHPALIALAWSAIAVLVDHIALVPAERARHRGHGPRGPRVRSRSKFRSSHRVARS